MLLKNTTWFAAFFLMMAIMSNCYAINTTLVVGDYASSEHDDPSGDSVFTDNSHNFGQTIAIHKETALRQITVFNWSGIQYVMEMFCNGSGNHTYLQLTHNYISAGKSYNGHPLYKTSIPGFYFTIEMTFLQPAENMTSSTFWFDKTSTPITSEFTEFPSACSRTNVYSNLGKLMYGLKIYAYVDSDFAPTEAQLQSFTLSKNGDSDFYIDNPGSGLSNYKMKFNLAATGLKAVWPTCSASTISGTNVSGSTVKLGSFYPKQIMEGLSPTKFQINLSSCQYINNIEVKLASNNVGTKNTSLLTNNSTSNTKASGIGVLIEGLKSSSSAQMVLKPNDSSSIYKDTTNNTGDGSPVGSATKSLYFQATLKPDGDNPTINPGDFKATAQFSITYP
ncbi:fimbrial protein [Salmonella enterica]|nr:fimbrial protein [Salmonella enterica]EBG4349672.1 fimbrial protein [Salmonella enterica]